jgi:hypothetical protein
MTKSSSAAQMRRTRRAAAGWSDCRIARTLPRGGAPLTSRRRGWACLAEERTRCAEDGVWGEGVAQGRLCPWAGDNGWPRDLAEAALAIRSERSKVRCRPVPKASVDAAATPGRCI